MQRERRAGRLTIAVNVRSALEHFSGRPDLPSSLVEEMERAASTVRVARGTFYCHVGDACKGVALLERGDIRVFKTGPTGREITLYHVSPGQTCLLTLNGALTGEPYPADALVEEDVEAAVLPVAQFRSWMDRHPSFRLFVFRSMAERIADLMSLVDEVAFGKLNQRLAEFLLAGFSPAATPGAVLQVTHDQIAAELGSAREVISRLLKDFERQGALRLGRGKLELQDESRLRSLLNKK